MIVEHFQVIKTRSAPLIAVALTIVLSSFGGAAHAAQLGDARLSADPAAAPMLSVRSVAMRGVPVVGDVAMRRRPAFMPLMVGTDPSTWFARKEAALGGIAAPRDPFSFSPYDFAPARTLTV